jgi:phosphorylase kinase alpha/beta subunit
LVCWFWTFSEQKTNKEQEAQMFPRTAVLRHFDALRRPSGAFIAAPSPDYSAMWIRDHCYCVLAYKYLGRTQEFLEGIWLLFDLFSRYQGVLDARIASPVPDQSRVPGTIHAKYDADTFQEITPDWGHHQLDALGLFLAIVGDAEADGIHVVRSGAQRQTIQRLIAYLRSVEYWRVPDFGLWEECEIRHSSSIGAVLAGLVAIRDAGVAVVPDLLIAKGEAALNAILPEESRDPCRPHHDHSTDAAQLSLVWPLAVLTERQEQELLDRLLYGIGNDANLLVQRHGINRYWGDAVLGIHHLQHTRRTRRRLRVVPVRVRSDYGRRHDS